MPQAHEWNRLVNSKWPEGLQKPSAQEAITGAKRLYRRAMGRPFRGKVVATSGNRYTWARSGVLHVNPNRHGCGLSGWPEIIHMLAHLCHRNLHRGDRPHSYRELEIEADLTRYAIEQGFHEGRLKRPTRTPKPKPDRKIVSHEAAVASLKRWETKAKRAEKAMKKYRKKVRYYEKLQAA